jgi:hypothetical protein
MSEATTAAVRGVRRRIGDDGGSGRERSEVGGEPSPVTGHRKRPSGSSTPRPDSPTSTRPQKLIVAKEALKRLGQQQLLARGLVQR